MINLVCHFNSEKNSLETAMGWSTFQQKDGSFSKTKLVRMKKDPYDGCLMKHGFLKSVSM